MNKKIIFGIMAVGIPLAFSDFILDKNSNGLVPLIGLILFLVGGFLWVNESKSAQGEKYE